MESCPPPTYSLENPVFLRNLCFLLTCLQSIVTGYTMHLMINHSPAQMKEMRWYMLNMAVWTRAMDLMYSLLVIPYFFIPTLVVLPVGVLQMLGVWTQVQLAMLLVTISGLGQSVVLMFENRFNAIAPSYFPLKIRHRRFYHSFMFTVALSVLASSFLKLEDQWTAKQGYLKIQAFKCPIPQFYTEAFSFKPESVGLLVVTVLLFSLIISGQVIFFALSSFYFLYSLERSKMSVATRKLQRKFFLTAWLQVFTHLAVIVVPMGYTFFTFILVYRNQVLVNIALIVITFHGTITSISTLAINRPFRIRVKQWLCPKMSNRRSSTRINLITVSSSWM